MFVQNRLFDRAITLMLGVIVGVGGLRLLNRTRPAPIVIEPPPPTATPVPTTTPGPVQVFVNGAVRMPGVYELSPESRVEAAVEAAGGYSAEANTAVVNLAQPLRDGAHIYVPDTSVETAVPSSVLSHPGTEATGGEANGSSTAGELININTAALETLDELPGIGPSTAQKIIDHRENNGPFATIEAIKDVSGIGDAKFEQIKDLITIGD